jgi:hypothetical protein
MKMHKLILQNNIAKEQNIIKLKGGKELWQTEEIRY